MKGEKKCSSPLLSLEGDDMRIGGTEINLAFKAFEIYVSGCKAPHCKGCHNAELWTFTVGDCWNAEKGKILEDKANELHLAGLADYAWILGGEPLDQNLDNLGDLIRRMSHAGLKIVLWTHYYSIPEEIASLIDYVKVGPYIEGKEEYVEPIFGVKLANEEQRIYSMADYKNQV